MRVVIAPDSFKGTISATDAAAAISAGWLSVRPGDSIALVPQADGGEGTLDVVMTAVAGAMRCDAGVVQGPDGRQTRGEWVQLPDGTAVVELAQMCGLPLLRELDAEGSSTVGLGQVLRAALDSGATGLLVGLGGSASTDAGAGALAALGLEADAPLTDGGSALAQLRKLDRCGLRELPPNGLTILTDVDAPLTGPRGAAAVYAPQKGANPAQIARLEAGVTRFAELFGGPTDIAGMGAAGGTGYGLARWGGELRSGAEWIATITALENQIESADLVITGEGSFDATSLTGKLVGETLATCRRLGTPVGVIAGRVAVDPGADVWTASLSELAESAAAAIASPQRWLHEAAIRAARHFG